jgi:DNA-binding MarR family transcriptional regulator
LSAAKYRSRSVNRPEDHLGYWLTAVSSKVMASLARRLAALDVSVSEWIAMGKLFDQRAPISISSLAQQMGLTKAPVSRLVERLVEKELVDRQDNRNDGRAQQIWLSSAGQKLVPKLAAIADENEEAFFGYLPMSGRLTMIALMKDVANQYRLAQAGDE